MCFSYRAVPRGGQTNGWGPQSHFLSSLLALPTSFILFKSSQEVLLPAPICLPYRQIMTMGKKGSTTSKLLLLTPP